MRKDGADRLYICTVFPCLWGMELSILVIQDRKDDFLLVWGQCLRNLPGALFKSWGLVRLIFEEEAKLREQGTGERNAPRFLFRFIEREGLE